MRSLTMACSQTAQTHLPTVGSVHCGSCPPTPINNYENGPHRPARVDSSADVPSSRLTLVGAKLTNINQYTDQPAMALTLIHRLYRLPEVSYECSPEKASSQFIDGLGFIQHLSTKPSFGYLPHHFLIISTNMFISTMSSQGIIKGNISTSMGCPLIEHQNGSYLSTIMKTMAKSISGERH